MKTPTPIRTAEEILKEVGWFPHHDKDLNARIPTKYVLQFMHEYHNQFQQPEQGSEVDLKWTEWIKQYHKLQKFWNMIPEPANILFRQQIDNYGKHLLNSKPANEQVGEEILRNAFEAGRSYQIGEYAEYHGGEENEKPNCTEWIKSNLLNSKPANEK